MRGSILGSVVEAETLLAVRGAVVTLRADIEASSSGDLSAVGVERRKITGEAGDFLFSDVPPGHWIVSCMTDSDVVVSADVYVDRDAAVAVQLERPTAGQDHRRAGPHARGVIKGVVRRDESDEPLPDVSVRIVKGPEGAPDIAALTGADGGFSLEGLAPGKWVLEAISSDREKARITVTVDSEGTPPVIVRIKKKS